MSMESSTTKATIRHDLFCGNSSREADSNKLLYSEQAEYRRGERLPWSSAAHGRKAQDSFDSLVSSMFMSLNSLDSKISPHSWHSTNSESSSRATICTRGCLHGSALFWGGGNLRRMA